MIRHRSRRLELISSMKGTHRCIVNMYNWWERSVFCYRISSAMRLPSFLFSSAKYTTLYTGNRRKGKVTMNRQSDSVDKGNKLKGVAGPQFRSQLPGT